MCLRSPDEKAHWVEADKVYVRLKLLWAAAKMETLVLFCKAEKANWCTPPKEEASVLLVTHDCEGVIC